MTKSLPKRLQLCKEYREKIDAQGLRQVVQWKHKNLRRVAQQDLDQDKHVNEA